MTTHRQVNVNGIDVDEGLATLLEYVWEAGIQTQFSCQGDPGLAMILFPTITDGLRFVQETFAVTGYYTCYTDRLTMHIAGPVEDSVRLIVEWPPRLTPAWEAAWNGTPLPLEDFLELAEPGYKAEIARLEREESAGLGLLVGKNQESSGK